MVAKDLIRCSDRSRVLTVTQRVLRLEIVKNRAILGLIAALQILESHPRLTDNLAALDNRV
jgi:hypothetical protein